MMGTEITIDLRLVEANPRLWPLGEVSICYFPVLEKPGATPWASVHGWQVFPADIFRRRKPASVEMPR